MGVRFFTYVFYSFVFLICIYIHVIIILMCAYNPFGALLLARYCSYLFSKQYKLFFYP
jgi:hypothetical protein